MNKKVFVIAALLLALPVLTAMAHATPWTERNNDKFQTYEATGTFSILDFLTAERQYIPSFDEVNKMIVSWEGPHLTHQIMVGGNTYQLGTDFLYTDGLTIEAIYDPVFSDPAKLMPDDYRARNIRVYWTYDFSAFPGGIEGTLRMQLVAPDEKNRFVNSLSGTGDLENVQIKATASTSFTPPTTLNSLHVGIVSGWPE
jgi:hypothetical protein